MALPLIAAIIATATAIHQSNKTHYRYVERQRRLERDNFEWRSTAQQTKQVTPHVKKMPSDTYDSGIFVTPLPGSVVCCEVYGAFDHTGIWLDSDTIIELSNSGLVKAVSSRRFLSERSGKQIFVACDNTHCPIVMAGCEQRAIDNLFSFRKYDVVRNNCHRFVHYCVSDKNIELTTFANLNKQLAALSGQNIYWDKVKVPAD